MTFPGVGTFAGHQWGHSWPPVGRPRLIGKFGEGLPVKLDRD